MARTSKPLEFASKRSEILDAVQRIVFTKGYEQMSIQDVLDEIKISSGAFHHYFNSRRDLLDAFIDKILAESEKPLLPILHDPHLTAIQKLQGFFDTLDQLSQSRRAEVAILMRVWYTDKNALIRKRVDDAVFFQRKPMMTEIIRQGIREGSITASHPEKAAEAILALLQGMGNAHARLLLSVEAERGDPGLVDEIIAIQAAFTEAIERVLGAPVNVLRRTDATAVAIWMNALQGKK